MGPSGIKIKECPKHPRLRDPSQLFFGIISRFINAAYKAHASGQNHPSPEKPTFEQQAIITFLYLVFHFL